MLTCYKQIKRFFAQVHFDQLQIARWLLSLFFDSIDKIYLTVDRTNWFWGKKKINLLMMAVAYEGMAIPLFWKALPKAGNAGAIEHQQIIQRFVKTFGQTRIAGILADREFASGALLRWLNQQRLPFYIRIKENSELRIRRKKFQSAKKLFRHVSVKQQSVFAMTIEQNPFN